MAEELPYIPTEIVNIIAQYTEGSSLRAFYKTSKFYYNFLNHEMTTYMKQSQLETIKKKHVVTINDKIYYGNQYIVYCYECGIGINRKKNITHNCKNYSNKKPLICIDCESPRHYHKSFKGKCAFSKFNCGQCGGEYYNYEHDSRTCSKRIVCCSSCRNRYRLEQVINYKEYKYICKCNSIIDVKKNEKWNTYLYY